MSGRAPQTENFHSIERRPGKLTVIGDTRFFEYHWSCRCGAVIFDRSPDVAEAFSNVCAQQRKHLERAVQNEKSR
jgi:hypothetical protein